MKCGKLIRGNKDTGKNPLLARLRKIRLRFFTVHEEQTVTILEAYYYMKMVKL